MPRTARASVGDLCDHILNRGNARGEVFHKSGDYHAFRTLLSTACRRIPMRVLAYCLMPNHFHLALWPQADGDLSRWMQWVLTAHVRRYHRHYGSSGHVWQGRFKAFPIQADGHLLTVLRYIERNPVRAGLVARAEDWPWSSAKEWGCPGSDLESGPVPRPPEWLGWVNEALSDPEVEQVRQCLVRGRPWGTDEWARSIAQRLGLEDSLRPRGRPRKQETR